MRSSTADVIETLAKPLQLDLERAMELCAPDECVEVTPEIVRIRKVELAAAAGLAAGRAPRRVASNLARWPRERNATAKSSPAFRSRVTLVGYWIA